MLLGKGVWHGEGFRVRSHPLVYFGLALVWYFSRTCFADVMARVAQSNDCSKSAGPRRRRLFMPSQLLILLSKLRLWPWPYQFSLASADCAIR
jgi:hypothetical protein